MLLPNHIWSLEAGISRLEHPKMAEAFAGKELRWLITQPPVWATGIRHMICPPPVCKDCIALVKSDSSYLFRLQCIQVIWYKYGERLFRIDGEMSLSLKNVCISQNMPEPNHIICNSIELKHCSIVTHTLYEVGDWFQHVTIVLLYGLMNVYILISHDCVYIVVCRGTLVLEDLNILWLTRDHRVKVKYHHLLGQLIVACLIPEHHLKQWSLIANLKIHYL